MRFTSVGLIGEKIDEWKNPFDRMWVSHYQGNEGYCGWRGNRKPQEWHTNKQSLRETGHIRHPYYPLMAAPVGLRDRASLGHFYFDGNHCLWNSLCQCSDCHKLVVISSYPCVWFKALMKARTCWKTLLVVKVSFSGAFESVCLCLHEHLCFYLSCAEFIYTFFEESTQGWHEPVVIMT